METVLVTAASGNAGKSTVEALLAKGFNVIGTSREPKKLSFSKPIEGRIYDANDKKFDFDALLQGIDHVVLIGPPLDGQLSEKLEPFIKAAVEHNIKHVVFMSGNYLSGFSGRSLAQLAQRKVEVQLIDSGLMHTLVRASFFMDNFLSGFYAPMIEQGRLSLAVGNATSAFVAGADVGEFIAEALHQGLTGEYTVTGPESLNHTEVVELLSKKTGRTITYNPITVQQLEGMYRSKGLPEETLQYGLALYTAVRNYATAAVTDSFNQATGHEPMTFRKYLSLD